MFKVISLSLFAGFTLDISAPGSVTEGENLAVMVTLGLPSQGSAIEVNATINFSEDTDGTLQLNSAWEFFTANCQGIPLLSGMESTSLSLCSSCWWDKIAFFTMH